MRSFVQVVGNLVAVGYVAADRSSRPGCSKDELRRQMSWDLITRPSGTDTDRPCPVADCPCNETCNPGPMLEV